MDGSTLPVGQALPYATVQAHWYDPYVPSWNLSAYSFADALGNYIINYDSGYTWYCLLAAPITYKCQVGSDIDDLIPCMVSSYYHPYYGMPTNVSFAMAWDYAIPYSKSDCTNLCFHITNSLQNYYYTIHDGFGLGYRIQAWAHWQVEPWNAKYLPAPDRSLNFGAGDGLINNAARARDCILHELQHAVTDVIYDPAQFPPPSWDYIVINEAYSDYFACTQTNDPVFAEWWAPLLARDNSQYYRYPENYSLVDQYTAMLVPGSTFWNIRTELGQSVADQVIFKSIIYEPISLSGLRLACELSATSLGLPPATVTAISTIFALHGIY